MFPNMVNVVRCYHAWLKTGG